MAVSRRSYKGAPVSNTLGGAGLAAGATSIALASAMSGWPTSSQPFFVVVDPGTSKEEKICVKYNNSTTLTVVDPAVTSSWPASANGRGADDTTDRTHDAGAIIYPVFTAFEADDANELASAYTENGDLVVHGSTSFKKIGVGANAYVLQADSSVTDGGVKWAQIGTSSIADSAVTSAKIADGTIVLADLASAVQNLLVPTGTITAYAGASAPTGWLLCDGTSTTGYTALAALVGSTTPDLRGKFLMGKTASGTGSTLLGSGGSTTIAETNLPSHTHSAGTLATASTGSHIHAATSVTAGVHAHDVTIIDPGHKHQYTSPTTGSYTVVNAADTSLTVGDGVETTTDTGSSGTGITASTASTGGHVHTIDVDYGGTHSHTVSGSTGSTGSGTAYYQPFVAVSYIIKT